MKTEKMKTEKMTSENKSEELNDVVFEFFYKTEAGKLVPVFWTVVKDLTNPEKEEVGAFFFMSKNGHYNIVESHYERSIINRQLIRAEKMGFI